MILPCNCLFSTQVLSLPLFKDMQYSSLSWILPILAAIIPDPIFSSALNLRAHTYADQRIPPRTSCRGLRFVLSAFLPGVRAFIRLPFEIRHQERILLTWPAESRRTQKQPKEVNRALHVTIERRHVQVKRQRFSEASVHFWAFYFFIF